MSDSARVKVAVLYHKNCTDGFMAATVAREYFSDNKYDCEYIPMGHADHLPDRLTDYEFIYMVDYARSSSEIEQLCKHSKVIVIDHHIGVHDDLSKINNLNFTYCFDNDKSGALLCSEYFKVFVNSPAIALISDNDLWNHKYPQSRPFAAYMNSIEYDFNLWREIALYQQNAIDDVVNKGQIIEDYKHHIASRLSEKPIFLDIAGFRVPAVNIPNQFFASIVGEKLLDCHPTAKFSIVFSIGRDCGAAVSLRSRKSDDDVNVADIAGKYGGSGHKSAAGFLLNTYGLCNLLQGRMM